MGNRSLVAALALLACALTALASCARPRPAADAGPGPAIVPAAAASAQEGPSPDERAERSCRAARDRINELPALPGAPGFEARRGEILLRARAEPGVFLRTPGGERGRSLADIKHALSHRHRAPEQFRAALLRDGYVYSDDPASVVGVVSLARLEWMFREPEVYLLRGAEVSRLARDARLGLYLYADGPARGEAATLRLGDRVALTREELSPALHRDLSALVRAEGAERVRFVRLTAGGALAELRFGGRWVPAVLADDGLSYRVECLPGGVGDGELATARREAVRREAALGRVRAAVREMVRERLRFDEPLEEVGQQDGSLRPLWRLAYLRGDRWFGFNGHGYGVFDAAGRPVPPQVCVDFVLDAFERASGTWYGARDAPRARARGTIDFDASGMDNRRSASQLVSFAQVHPEAFDVWNLPDGERVPFARTRAFYTYLVAHAERFHPGDVVVIHGLRADEKPHYHTFLVDAVDPVSGVPYQLAGNAGRPRLQTWAGIMWSAPRRSIRHVLSLRTGWLLEHLAGTDG